jgi:hypothetical protein
MADLFALGKYHPGTGAYWKRKKEKKANSGSRTDGRTKARCKITYLDKHMAKASRSYKHRDYPSWRKSKRGI